MSNNDNLPPIAQALELSTSKAVSALFARKDDAPQQRALAAIAEKHPHWDRGWDMARYPKPTHLPHDYDLPPLENFHIRSDTKALDYYGGLSPHSTTRYDEMISSDDGFSQHPYDRRDERVPNHDALACSWWQGSPGLK